MPAASILMILALLILVALFVARPFLDTAPTWKEEDGQRSAWLAERERIIEALLELDFDQELGKIPEEIYAIQREKLLRQGSQILQRLDEQGVTESFAELEPEDSLEAMIAARKVERGR